MSTGYPPRSPKRAAAPILNDPNALYVVQIAPDAHSIPMLFDDAMSEWKKTVATFPDARIRPWEWVEADEARRG